MKRTYLLIWLIYLALLLVLLPHTAWLFQQFEPPTAWGALTAWAGAFSFEAAIAVLTHKLAKHWENAPVRAARWSASALYRLRYSYGNAYSAGLAVAVSVSALANLAHAVEFGSELAILGAWGISPAVYQIASGGILPLVSVLFARVLSNANESEPEANPELEAAKAQAAQLRQQLRQAEDRAKTAEAQAAAASARFDAAGDMFAALMGAEKRERIVAARQQWPQLPAAAIAIIAGASAGYVSDVLRDVAHE